MTETQLTSLRTALDQLADLLDGVDAEDASRPTACSQWTLGQLADHVVGGTANFTVMMRGETPDWSAPRPARDGDWGQALRSEADALFTAADEAENPGAATGMMLPELAVHTWDVASALGEPTSELDPAPAEQGLEFMQANLTDDKRGEAFGPAREAPDGSDAYQRIAAFAGRTV